MGGGVNLDLIHEIDYALWLFGRPLRSTSFFSKVSSLNIDSYDYTHYLLEYSNMHVSITLNYYRRDSKRCIELVTDKKTIYADLISGQITDSNEEVLFSYPNPVQETYNMQMDYFINNLTDSNCFMNDIEESLAVLNYALNPLITNEK
jgi:predicted dehydrogenase